MQRFHVVECACWVKQGSLAGLWCTMDYAHTPQTVYVMEFFALQNVYSSTWCALKTRGGQRVGGVQGFLAEFSVVLDVDRGKGEVCKPKLTLVVGVLTRASTRQV